MAQEGWPILTPFQDLREHVLYGGLISRPSRALSKSGWAIKYLIHDSWEVSWSKRSNNPRCGNLAFLPGASCLRIFTLSLVYLISRPGVWQIIANALSGPTWERGCERSVRLRTWTPRRVASVRSPRFSVSGQPSFSLRLSNVYAELWFVQLDKLVLCVFPNIILSRRTSHWSEFSP